jgi:hypothetical protein
MERDHQQDQENSLKKSQQKHLRNSKKALKTVYSSQNRSITWACLQKIHNYSKKILAKMKIM